MLLRMFNVVRHSLTGQRETALLASENAPAFSVRFQFRFYRYAVTNEQNHIQCRTSQRESQRKTTLLASENALSFSVPVLPLCCH